MKLFLSDLAASRKETKCTCHTDSYIFQPIAVESHIQCKMPLLPYFLGKRLTENSSETSYHTLRAGSIVSG